MTSIKFYDVTGFCTAPIVVSAAGVRIVVEDAAPCCKIPFHRFAGQEFATEGGEPIAIGEIFSRATRYNKAAYAVFCDE